MKKQKRKHNRGGKRSIRVILAGAALLLASAGFMLLASRVPSFAQWYSVNVYSLLVSAIGRLSGMVSFSVSEICIYILLAVFAGSAVYTVIKCIRRKKAKDRLFR